jgi:acetyl esterase
MPVDPEIDAVLKLFASLTKDSPPLWEIPVSEARKAMEEGAEMFAAGSPKIDVGKVEDMEVDGRGGTIPIRVYTPKEQGENSGTVVFYHGGGFVLGSIGEYDPICRALTSTSGCTLVSVGYRLAPEHKAPAAAREAYDALQWAIGNLGSNGVAVAGDSAGGNLAASVCLRARDIGEGIEKIKLQVLAYPPTDLDAIFPSTIEYGEGYFLTRGEMEWFHTSYLVDRSQASDPYISPLRARDLSKLPPAVILTGEYDPLRDQGEAYAARLRLSGVPVVGVRYTGAIHGFLSFSGTRIATNALNLVGTSLKSAFKT